MHRRSIKRLTIDSDLRCVQEKLLGKSVIATLDVVRISTRAGQDHCASETLRVLEDAERQRSLLYYAHKMSAKSVTHSPGFVEWSRMLTILLISLIALTTLSVNDFEDIKKVDKKKVRLTFGRQDNFTRRSTIGSIDSVLSHDSTSSKDSQMNTMDRIKAIDCEFYDQEGTLHCTICRHPIADSQSRS